MKDQACFKKFQVYSDRRCKSETWQLKGASTLMVDGCDAANKIYLGGCMEGMVYFVEGANFGPDCASASAAIEDPTKWTAIKYNYHPRKGDVDCVEFKSADGAKLYASIEPAGWMMGSSGMMDKDGMWSTGAFSFAAAFTTSALAVAATQF